MSVNEIKSIDRMKEVLTIDGIVYVISLYRNM